MKASKSKKRPYRPKNKHLTVTVNLLTYEVLASLKPGQTVSDLIG